jgi:hypothetical protein
MHYADKREVLQAHVVQVYKLCEMNSNNWGPNLLI